MGILDQYPELALGESDKNDALNMGLLQAGLGILANNTSRNGMPAIAKGGMMGLQGYQQSMDRAQAKKLEELKMRDVMEKYKQQKLLQDRKNAIINDPATDPTIKAYLQQGGDLEELFKPRAIKEGETFGMPDFKGGFKQLATGAAKAPKKDTKLLPISETMQQEFVTVDGVPDMKQPVGAARPIFNPRPQTVVNNITKAETAGAVELAKLDAKRVDELRTQGDAARNALANVQQMKQAVNGGIYSGTGATWRMQSANFFDTLGVPVDSAKLSNSQQYEKYAKELTLAALKQAMGSTQISNTDREFVDATVPQLQTNPAARIALLDYIEQKAKKAITNSVKADNYFREKGSLKGFTVDTDSGGGWKDL